MDDVLAYVLYEAPDDVTATTRWLSDRGFEITDQVGGRNAPFGDAQLTFRRRDLGVRVTRDRSQWSLDVAPEGVDFLPLDRILTAKDGIVPKVPQSFVHARTAPEWSVVDHRGSRGR